MKDALVQFPTKLQNEPGQSRAASCFLFNVELITSFSVARSGSDISEVILKGISM